MDCRPRRRSWACGPAVVLLALAVLSGCAQPETLPGGSEGRSGHPVDEVAAHRGRPCPKKLPPASTESYGFGVSDPADSAPALPVPEAAWVCRYDPRDSGPGPDGDGTTVGWVRHGAPRPVPSSRLPALEDQLRELVPAVADSVCTMDLGSRWMLVYSAGTDLTGVVVDDFGCQEVRLTDEPFRTVPGEATQPGTVPGVLTAPRALLTQLKAGR